MLSPLYEKPTVEPSNAEIDEAVNSWDEWRDLERRFPPAMMETFRPVFRSRWYERHYRRLSDAAAFMIPGVEDTAIIFPLENIA